MSFEKLGASGDSLRLRNNEWYIARSFEQDADIKVFKVNQLNRIEFFTTPSVAGDEFVLMSTFLALEVRVAILEAIVSGITAGNINIVPFTLSPADIIAKSLTLPQAPIPGTSMIIPANGITQFGGIDFTVVGTTLSWNGSPFEGLAQAGDVIKVIYLF